MALIPKAAADLAALQRTGLSKTDLVNRAITLYAFIEAEMSSGSQVLIRHEGEADKVVRFL